MIKILEFGSERDRPFEWTTVALPPIVESDPPHEYSSNHVKFDGTYVPYPFADKSYDAAYSEHFIEHLHRFEGIRYLEEMRRILKPGGVLRIAWPSMDFVDWLIYQADDRDPYVEEYIRYWLALKEDHDNNPKWKHLYYPGPDAQRTWKENTIRGLLHQSGEHKYLWYVQEMKDMLKYIGYIDIKEQDTSNSYISEFEGIEEMQSMLRRTETTIIECRKPL